METSELRQFGGTQRISKAITRSQCFLLASGAGAAQTNSGLGGARVDRVRLVVGLRKVWPGLAQREHLFGHRSCAEYADERLVCFRGGSAVGARSPERHT